MVDARLSNLQKYTIYWMYVQGTYFSYSAYPLSSFHNFVDFIICIVSFVAAGLHINTQRVKKKNRQQYFTQIRSRHLFDIKEQNVHIPANVYHPPSILN